MKWFLITLAAALLYTIAMARAAGRPMPLPGNPAERNTNDQNQKED